MNLNEEPVPTELLERVRHVKDTKKIELLFNMFDKMLRVLC